LNQKFQNNIKKIYLFNFFWMFLILIPVVVPYFISLGLNMEEVFQLQAIFGFSTALFEVPSGYFCDIWGRKKTIIIGSFVSGLGFTWLCFIDSFSQLVLFEVIIGISLSLVSGADISLLYDSLQHVSDEREERTKAMANYQFSYTVAESIGSIIGGLLVKISYKAVLYAHAAVAGWMPFLVALTLIEPPREKLMEKGSHIENFKKILKYVFIDDRLLRLIFINLVIWGLSTFIAVWIFQKYWQEGSIPLYSFGLLWAGYNLTVGLMGKQVHFLEKKYGPTTLLVALSLLPIFGYFGMAFFSGWIGVLFGLLFQLGRGITQVILKDALNWRIPGEFRATVNSLSSLFFRLGFALFGPLVGYLIDRQGINFTLNGLGLAFAILMVVFLLPLIREVRKILPKGIPEGSSLN
jgi:MFS family permease